MLNIKEIKGSFAVAKLRSAGDIDVCYNYTFLTKTDEEISLVCPEANLPEKYMECSRGWRMFKIEGLLDFSLVGIIARISKVLADNEVSIFVLSTFNTDYFMVQEEHYQKAKNALKNNGYNLV